MIINALNDYYTKLVASPNNAESDIAMPGYSVAGVSFVIIISKDGIIDGIVDLRDSKGKKSKKIIVPEIPKRAVNICPGFLCDSSAYIFGIDDKGKAGRAAKAFAAFREFNLSVLKGVEDEGALAFRKFLSLEKDGLLHESNLCENLMSELCKASYLVFKLNGDIGYLHERKEIKCAWEGFKNSSVGNKQSQCLITGKKMPIARLHPSIKGVRGAQAAGASIVSFNLDSFRSFGKEQGDNAPISEQVAFAYTTVLNKFLSGDKNKINFNGSTLIFWSERGSNSDEENLFRELFAENNQFIEIEEDVEDVKKTQFIKDVFQNVQLGKPLTSLINGIDEKSKFFILGLSPNAARISIRFWMVDSFGSIVDKIFRHHQDLRIQKDFDETNEFITIKAIMRASVPYIKGDRDWYKKVSPLLEGQIFTSVISGRPYPGGLFAKIISRIKSDGRINYVRCAIIKAFLLRNARIYKKNIMFEEVESMGLNENSTNVAYRLGRLFAILEKGQKDALGENINSTIKDRYFASATSMPQTVFPLLIKLSQHHFSKSIRSGWLEKLTEELLSEIDTFPSHLQLEDQGLFILGYYHQKNSLYKKKQKEDE